MFISRKDYDELNVRNVELARQVRDLSEENNQLRKAFKILRKLPY